FAYKSPITLRILEPRIIKIIATIIAMDPKYIKYSFVSIKAYSLTIWAFSPCAIAFDKNQTDIICDRKATGARLVVVERPIGETNNSPIVTKKKLNTRHSG